MTVDPNDIPQDEQTVEAPQAEAPVGVDVDVLADRVIEKLMTAAQTAAPEAQTQAYQQQPAAQNSVAGHTTNCRVEGKSTASSGSIPVRMN